MKLMMRVTDSNCKVPCIKVYNTSIMARRFLGERNEFEYDIICFGATKPILCGAWQIESIVAKYTFMKAGLHPDLWYWYIDYPPYFREFDETKDSYYPYFVIFRDILNGSQNCQLP